MNRARHRPVVAAIMLLMVHPAVRAEVYKWTDKKGTVHFTDDPEKLPEPLRSKALRELEKKEQEKKKKRKQTGDGNTPRLRRDELPRETLPPAPPAAEAPLPAPASEASPGPSTTKPSRQVWEQKAVRARQRVSELEKTCERLEQERDRSRRDSLTFARPADTAKAQEAARTLQGCRQDLQKARRYLEVELPEEARRQGVPPGWLR